MPDAMSSAELESHSAELLPARTVLSLMSADTVNNSPTGNMPGYTTDDPLMYGTWWYSWTQVLGLPHGGHNPEG